MAKVSDMIGDYAEPQGSLGYSVDTDLAIKLANEIREIMARDLDEEDIGMAAYLFNLAICRRDAEELLAAWMHLNAGERRAWKQYVAIGGKHAH